MRLSKVEGVFIAVPIVLVGVLIFNVLDAPTEIGPRLHGKILKCEGHGKFVSRTCLVQFNPTESRIINIQVGSGGDGVTVVEMKKGISGATYYVVVSNGDP